MGAQWLSCRVLDLRPRGRGFEPHRRHCIVDLSKNINPSSVLDQPRKTRPFITERLLMGRSESNQTNKPNIITQELSPYFAQMGTHLTINHQLQNHHLRRVSTRDQDLIYFTLYSPADLDPRFCKCFKYNLC